MAIITNQEFTRLEEGRITDCQYFLITGYVEGKNVFRATITPVRANGIHESSAWVCDIPMSIENPLLLRVAHDSAVEFLTNFNPSHTFEIVELDNG